MIDEQRVDRMEELFRQARRGDREAFAEWMGLAEIPLRRSLRRFARAADVEVVTQEALVRMWLVACDHERELVGDSASLRFALRVARNVALEEIRRNRQDRHVDLGKLDRLPEGRIDPDPGDPALGRMIYDCLERLPGQPRSALWARIHDGNRPDRELAQALRMKTNTFLQNIVRARRFLAECLERRGVHLGGIVS